MIILNPAPSWDSLVSLTPRVQEEGGRRKKNNKSDQVIGYLQNVGQLIVN